VKSEESGLWLTPDDAAARLQLHRNSIYEAIRQNKLRHARIGRRIRIRESWLDDLLQLPSMV
jgi:excisionase family DNA binding protein